MLNYQRIPSFQTMTRIQWNPPRVGKHHREGGPWLRNLVASTGIVVNILVIIWLMLMVNING